MQPRRGLSLGRPFGSSLLVSGSWLPAGALLIALLAASVYQLRSLTEALALASAAVGILFVLVLLHETGHFLVGRLTGVATTEVRLFVFGGLRTTDSGSPAAGLLTALSGPLVSAGVGGALLWSSGALEGAPSDLLEIGAWLSLGLAAVNLLPALPLDGGSAMAAIRHWRTGNRTVAIRKARRQGRLVGIMLVLGGLGLVAVDPWAIPESTLGLWGFLAGLFIMAQAGSMEDTPAQLATEPIGVWARPFAGRLDAADELPPTADAPYAVSDEGRLAGILPAYPPDMQAGGATMGTVREMMIPWGPELGVPQHLPASQALGRLARGEVPVLVVLDESGRVRGVVDETTVRRRLQEGA